MRVVQLAAGAGGMYCGSCLHDARLAATLRAQGRDVVLLPLYTPLRTDEEDVSRGDVHFGGLNVYLQRALPLFRRTPAWLDRLLDRPALLRWAGRRGGSTRPAKLGPLTLAVLEGEHGPLRKEVARLADTLRALQPHVVHLPNLLLAGVAPRLRATLRVPLVCGLTGEDIFVDALPEPWREQVLGRIAAAARDIDVFVAPTRYYATHAAQHFGLPAERIHTIAMGIRAADFAPPARNAPGRRHEPMPARGDPPPPVVPAAADPSGTAHATAAAPLTFAYLARICPEKGFDRAVRAVVALRAAGRAARLWAAGYVPPTERAWAAEVVFEARARAGDDAVEFLGEVDRAAKQALLWAADVLCLPTRYVESKGYPVLEALAAGVPAVVPDHGAFPELLAATGGGVTYPAGDDDALVAALAAPADDAPRRRELGRRGQAAVQAHFTAERMAADTWALYERLARLRR